MKIFLCAIKFFFLSGTILVLASTSHADVYKWVDKDGKVQYSDQPPLSGDAKKLRRKSKDSGEPAPAAPAGNAAAPAKSIADQELEFRKRKGEKEEAEKKQKADAEFAQKNKEYCDSLRNSLRTHGDGTRLVRYNEKGERIFLDDKERAAAKQNIEERLAKECK
jgi:Domain of unknown function (DUF4124)